MKISFFLVLGILKAKTDFRMLIFSYSVPPFKRTYWCSTMLCWYVLLLLKKKEEEKKEKKCTLLLCFVSFEPLSLHLSWFTLIENQNERDVHNPPPSHNPWCTFFFLWLVRFYFRLLLLINSIAFSHSLGRIQGEISTLVSNVIVWRWREWMCHFRERRVDGWWWWCM